MYLALPLLLLSLIVLQQTLNVESLVSPIKIDEIEAGRPNVARRLRAPLMGRSLLSVSAVHDDNVDHKNNESDSHSDSDENKLVVLNKRRHGAPLFGRRWIPLKRRGPLFG